MGFGNFGEPKKEESVDHLMCMANGCPNRWSVDVGTKLCSRHAFKTPREWPPVTDAIQKERMTGVTLKPTIIISDDEKTNILSRLEAKGIGKDRNWAHALKEREQRGDSITKYQRDCWREVLKEGL